MSSNIQIRNVYKVFGDNPKKAMEMARQGIGKAEILAATGCGVGLNNVSLDIPAGEIFVIMGLSGSGKSTLVRHLNRLIEPTAGEIVFGDTDVLKLDPAALRKFRTHRVSMVFQSFALAPHRTVMQNVIYGQSVRGTPKAEAEAIGRKWIATVGLSGHEDRYPHTLSGGMKQRVAIARALAMEPRVLLMDEPFAALDALTRRRMQEELLALWEDVRFTLLFVTHSIEEALVVGNRIALLSPHPGRMRAEINSHAWGLHSGGSPDFQAAANRIHSLLFEDGNAHDGKDGQ